jgi:hypothetical protein
MTFTFKSSAQPPIPKPPNGRGDGDNHANGKGIKEMISFS